MHRSRPPESISRGRRPASCPPRQVSAGDGGHDDVNPGVPVGLRRVPLARE